MVQTEKTNHKIHFQFNSINKYIISNQVYCSMDLKKYNIKLLNIYIYIMDLYNSPDYNNINKKQDIS